MNHQYGLGMSGSQHGNYNDPSYIIGKHNRAAADKLAASMRQPAKSGASQRVSSSASSKTARQELLIVLGILLGVMSLIAGGVAIFNAYAF